MTAEAILARKRALLERRRTAEDDFARQLLDEELRDLNARLRSLRGAPRAQAASRGGFTMDRAQYLRWQSDERGDEVREAHRVYLDTVRESAAVLTPRQRELFALWQEGAGMAEIAARLGIDRSTVSRTLARCKARLRAEAQTRTKTLPLEGLTVFDLSDREVARAILACVTARQAVCLYLYYGEWLSLRDCAELLGVDHTAVLRTVQRALRAIRDTLRCGEFTLDNADALGELAYELYVEAGMPDDAPPPERKAGWGRESLVRRRAPAKPASPAECTVRTSDGLTSCRGAAHRSPERPMGKLLTLLYGRRERGGLYRWLARLFEKITRNIRKRREMK